MNKMALLVVDFQEGLVAENPINNSILLII